MKGADEVPIDDGRIVQLKEMSNGCYVELYEQEENPGTQKHPPAGGYARQGSQFLLKPKPVFRHMQMLPISTDLKVRLARVLDNAIEWLDNGAGSEKDWFDDTTRADKLLKYAGDNWHDEAPGVMQDVAEELARQDTMLCNRSGDLFTLGEWGRPSGSYVATVSADESRRCPRCGAPKDEFWECIRSSRRTRVPNRYKCQNCGKTKTGITTG
jgi:rubredoxin